MRIELVHDPASLLINVDDPREMATLSGAFGLDKEGATLQLRRSDVTGPADVAGNRPVLGFQLAMFQDPNVSMAATEELIEEPDRPAKKPKKKKEN